MVLLKTDNLILFLIDYLKNICIFILKDNNTCNRNPKNAKKKNVHYKNDIYKI